MAPSQTSFVQMHIKVEWLCLQLNMACKQRHAGCNQADVLNRCTLMWACSAAAWPPRTEHGQQMQAPPDAGWLQPFMKTGWSVELPAGPWPNARVETLP